MQGAPTPVGATPNLGVEFLGVLGGLVALGVTSETSEDMRREDSSVNSVKNKEGTGCPLCCMVKDDLSLLFFDRKEFYFEDEG